MAKEKFTFEALPIQGNEKKEEVLIIYKEVKTRVAFVCDFNILEKLKDYGYWQGLTQEEIILQALDNFFKEKKVDPRPESVRNRKKVGRKSKLK